MTTNFLGLHEDDRATIADEMHHAREHCLTYGIPLDYAEQVARMLLGEEDCECPASRRGRDDLLPVCDCDCTGCAKCKWR